MREKISKQGNESRTKARLDRQKEEVKTKLRHVRKERKQKE
jgi:hypothetical protein